MAGRATATDDAEERRRGRRHKEIHGFTPVARWARLLRAELQRAGTPTRREMEKRVHHSASTISAVDKGLALPTWEKSEAYLRACDVPEADLPGWRQRHAAFLADEARLHPPVDRLYTRDDLRLAVLGLAQPLGLG